MKTALIAAAALFMLEGVAFADVQACVAASEKGQKLRSEGKLREARESFVVCGADACPALVRNDCTQWNAELQSALPSVVFGAKDRAGHDLFDVTVTMDGAPLVTKLDGKSVFVDPGKHTFTFEVPGMKTVTETALVKEGERARVIDVTFDAGDAAAPPKTAERGHTIPPWIVVGVGGAGVIAGVIVMATAPSRPSNCSRGTKTCTPKPGESAAQLADDESKAGQADARPVLGGVILGVGAALVAGGLIWHFVEPVGPEKTGLWISPWFSARSSGVGLGAAF